MFVLQRWVGAAACDRRGTLWPMLLAFRGIMADHNLEWVLEGGSLLGAFREHDVLKFEFDLDVTIFERDLQQFVALKAELLHTHGFHLVGKRDYNLKKALRTCWFVARSN